MRGFAALPLIIILVIVGIVGIGWYTFSTNQQAKITVSPSPSPAVSPSPSPTPSPIPTKTPVASPKASTAPLVDCVGPDGKHVSLTQKACDDFKKSWATPTPSPTPTQTSSQSSGCNTSTDLANLTVNIQPQSGQSLVGDAAVTMSNGSGDCAGHDSRLPYIQVIKQGSTSITFPSFRPGKFHIDVGYHGNNYGSDVSLNSGDNSTTVTVSN